jgi:hypothetical protein
MRSPEELQAPALTAMRGRDKNMTKEAARTSESPRPQVYANAAAQADVAACGRRARPRPRAAAFARPYVSQRQLRGAGRAVGASRRASSFGTAQHSAAQRHLGSDRADTAPGGDSDAPAAGSVRLLGPAADHAVYIAGSRCFFMMYTLSRSFVGS